MTKIVFHKNLPPKIIEGKQPVVAHGYPDDSWLYNNAPKMLTRVWTTKWRSTSGNCYWVQSGNPPEEFKLQLLLLGIN